MNPLPYLPALVAALAAYAADAAARQKTRAEGCAIIRRHIPSCP